MIIDCISDLHGFQPVLEGGDLLIVAGDLTSRDSEYQHQEFADWLEKQDYKNKIVIAGNHDGLLEAVEQEWAEKMFPGAKYLQDSGTTIEGLNIWGSPWTPKFMNWNFMKGRGKSIRAKWDMIPEDTDILVTHGPPYGILDNVNKSNKAQRGKPAGCRDLKNAVDRIKPKLHVFGHVHEGYGKVEIDGVIYVNAAIMDEDYDPVNKPIRIIL